MRGWRLLMVTGALAALQCLASAPAFADELVSDDQCDAPKHQVIVHTDPTGTVYICDNVL
jgi:hypothetical protein